MQRFNNWLALKFTSVIGTIWCAYVFIGIAFIALPQALETHSLTVMINWFSSNFLQLVLLPIIMVGQNLQGEASAKKMDELLEKIESQQIQEIEELEVIETEEKKQ